MYATVHEWLHTSKVRLLSPRTLDTEALIQMRNKAVLSQCCVLLPRVLLLGLGRERVGLGRDMLSLWGLLGIGLLLWLLRVRLVDVLGANLALLKQIVQNIASFLICFLTEELRYF